MSTDVDLEQRLKGTMSAEGFGLYRLADRRCLGELSQTPDNALLAARSAYLGVLSGRLTVRQATEQLDREPASLDTVQATWAKTCIMWLAGERKAARALLAKAEVTDEERPALDCQLGAFLACSKDHKGAWERFERASRHPQLPCPPHLVLAYRSGVKAVGRKEALALFKGRSLGERIAMWMGRTHARSVELLAHRSGVRGDTRDPGTRSLRACLRRAQRDRARSGFMAPTPHVALACLAGPRGIDDARRGGC